MDNAMSPTAEARVGPGYVVDSMPIRLVQAGASGCEPERVRLP